MVVQIGAVYDMLGDTHSALEWFERLNMHLPQDPGVLSRLGALHARSANKVCFLSLSVCFVSPVHALPQALPYPVYTLQQHVLPALPGATSSELTRSEEDWSGAM